MLATVALVALTLGKNDVEGTLTKEAYLEPPKPLKDSVTAPTWKNINRGAVSADGQWMMVTRSDGMPPLEWLAKPHRNLGGVQVDTVAHRARSLTTRSDVGVSFMSLSDGRLVELGVPNGVRVSGARFSPDGKKVAFLGLTPDSTDIYVATVPNGRVVKMRAPVRAVMSTSFDWSADSRRIVTLLAPENQGSPAPVSNVPLSPLVRRSDTKVDSLRTYAGLLESPEDMALLRYYALSQVGIIDTENARVTRIGKPAMIRSVDPAPDCSGYIVRTMGNTFDYLRPASSFEGRIVLWDAEGVEKHQISGPREEESNDEVLDDSVDDPWLVPDFHGEQRGGGGGQGAQAAGGMRSYAWHPHGLGLAYLERGPRPAEGEQQKDTVMLWKAPFGPDDKVKVWETEGQIGSVQYGESVDYLYVTRSANNHQTVTRIDLKNGGEPVTVLESNSSDFYTPGGSLVTKAGPMAGRVVMRRNDGKYYVSGTQYFRDPAKDAPRQFIKILDPAAEEKLTDFWQSREGFSESADLLDDEGARMLVSSESPTDVPNVFVAESGKEYRRLTDNIDYHPTLSQAKERRVTVTRPDGFKFEVVAYLPRYRTTGSDLPAMFWFYPTEYVDQATYDRSKRTYNKNSFRRVSSSSMMHLLDQGYVVVMNDCPIVGPSATPNDRFAHELRMSLASTIDTLAAERLIDRTRLAIGGHSYGGFGTANALIHTPYFKAGIAGAGNYNRSLTPFGFQREPRQLWQVREVYADVSALLHADKMTGAILLYHGMDDQNMGTAPDHSRRMFQALEAIGKPAALYMYPYEDHGQIAYETRLDLWARWLAWLDHYVKGQPVDPAKEGTPVP